MTTTDDVNEVFLIGIAAERAGMHPQTLRLYERRGLIRPRRDARNNRWYCAEDVARLRRIQALSEEGMNLAGIERVLRLEADLTAALRRVAALEAEIEEQRAAHAEQLRAARREGRAELVRVTRAQTAVVRYARKS